MLAVKSMDVRDNLKSLCDKVFHGETLIISRPKNENIVMLSGKIVLHPCLDHLPAAAGGLQKIAHPIVLLHSE